VRATTLLNSLLGIKSTRVTGVELTEEGVLCDVEPTTQIPYCGGCARRVPRVHDRREPRRWRHLDLAGVRLYLRYAPRRVHCPRCGVTTELVPWAEPMSWFTHAFEQTVAYLAQQASKTVVSSMMRVAWGTVGAIVGRVVDRLLPGDWLDGLTHIGVDELSYRKHHKYVTIVVDHRRGRVVWAREGKNAETLRSFFEELGSERSARIEAVTIDMSQAYIAAVSESAKNARIIFDRFHVQRLVQDALDEVRRAEVRSVDVPADRRALKHTRFALLKSRWNLTALEERKLTELPKTNATLYRAYLMKEAFAAILDRQQPNVVRTKLEEWTSWATHSGLKPFAKAARTIGKYMDGIVAYVATGLSNARSEATNGKVRTITRRSYGLHGAAALIALIRLCCSGLTLQPAHAAPRFHQT
jgi:transposase